MRSLPVVFKAAVFIFAGILKGMCGRYALTQNESELIEEFGITEILPKADPLPANWNVKPTEKFILFVTVKITEYSLLLLGESSRHGVKMMSKRYGVNRKQSTLVRNRFMRSQLLETDLNRNDV